MQYVMRERTVLWLDVCNKGVWSQVPFAKCVNKVMGEQVVLIRKCTSVQRGMESLETGKAIQTETEECTAEDENKVHEVEEHGDHEESRDGTAPLNLDQDKSEFLLPVEVAELFKCFAQNVESPVSINEPQESETSEVKSPTGPEILQQMPVNFQEDQAAGSTFEPGESNGLNEVRENFLEKIKEESREEERFEAKEGMERVSLVQSEASSDSKKGDDTSPSVACEEINSVGQSSSIPSSSEVAPALGLHENERLKSVIEELKVEENKVESIKRDKMATESLLQETIEKHQAELADYYTNALAALIALVSAMKAEARVNNEARIELESRLREAEERESMLLVQASEELRRRLSQRELEVAVIFCIILYTNLARVNNEARIELDSCLREAEERESMLVQESEELRRRLSQRELEVAMTFCIILYTDVTHVNNEARIELESRLRESEERESMLVQASEELRRRLSQRELEILRVRSAEMRERDYQASLSRYEQLAQIPESTTSLLRKIEVLQETNARKDDELASYKSCLASMGSMRDSLAEELVKMTEHCEKLLGEASTLPGLQAELEELIESLIGIQNVLFWLTQEGGI